MNPNLSSQQSIFLRAPMLIVQPSSCFGDRICEELDSEQAGQRQWQTFEFAVAWVNRAGAESIEESARNFLTAGKRIRATVGLDFSSTSYEGLGRLLDLEVDRADIETHVFFDENPACTFHPKIFLFSSTERARLFVGSNNMTGAGLETNVEAALEFTGSSDAETILAAQQALKAWRDADGEPKISQRLTREFLERLLEHRYVRTEEQLRARRAAEAELRSSRGEPLFGRSTTRARRPDRGAGTGAAGTGAAGTGAAGGGEAGAGTATSGLEDVLLMRVRPRRTGTQFQISMKVHGAAFMNSADEVVSAADGSHRGVGYDYITRNNKKVRNLARFEAPELAGLTNPVARFRWVNVTNSDGQTRKQLRYEIFDADRGGEGARIYEKLKAGIGTPPVTNLRQLSKTQTVLSKSNRATAQWYRLDSV